MTAIAKVYWRAINRGTRSFASIPANVMDDVRALAAQDLASGVISPELYSALLPAENVAEDDADE